MKNLPCHVFLAALASLALAVLASSLGLSFPFFKVAAIIIGFSGAAGVLALFLADYGARPSRDDAPVSAPETMRASAPVAPAAVKLRRVFRPGRQTGAGDPLATLGLRNDPATLSLL